MTTKAIRIQLPGGPLYAPAFDEAASKTGARSGLPTKHANTLNKLVHTAVAMLNSGDATMITLEMTVHNDSISVKLVGKACTSPTKRLVKELATLAEKRASSFESKDTANALTVAFDC